MQSKVDREFPHSNERERSEDAREKKPNKQKIQTPETTRALTGQKNAPLMTGEHLEKGG